MDEIHGLILIVLLLWTPLAHAQQLLVPPSNQGFVPRHERVAASVLRQRGSAGPAGMAPSGRLAGGRQVTPQESASPTSDLAPPAPPAAAFETVDVPQGATAMTGSGNAAPISVPPPAMPMPDQGMIGHPANFPSGPVDCEPCNSGSCWIDTFSLNLGVAGFKNAINDGRSGSFGFQQGMNWASLGTFKPLGMNTQFGFRTIQSEFGGTQFDGGSINNDHRAQYFVTAGFFQRVNCGWQGGLVFDYLRDEWISQLDLGQLRGELSWAAPNGSSVGFWFTSSVMEDTGRGLSDAVQLQEFDTREIYAFFYQVQSNKHRLGRWRVYAGFTGDSDGLIGSDFKLPLAGTWSLEPEFTYMVPDESPQRGAPGEEGWNVAFNLVWYPGRVVHGIDYRKLPLFDVAGNGSMISRRSR